MLADFRNIQEYQQLTRMQRERGRQQNGLPLATSPVRKPARANSAAAGLHTVPPPRSARTAGAYAYSSTPARSSRAPAASATTMPRGAAAPAVNNPSAPWQQVPHPAAASGPPLNGSSPDDSTTARHSLWLRRNPLYSPPAKSTAQAPISTPSSNQKPPAPRPQHKPGVQTMSAQALSSRVSPQVVYSAANPSSPGKGQQPVPTLPMALLAGSRSGSCMASPNRSSFGGQGQRPCSSTSCQFHAPYEED